MKQFKKSLQGTTVELMFSDASVRTTQACGHRPAAAGIVVPMAARDLTVVLEKAHDPDPDVRSQCEHHLQELEKQDFPSYVVSLTAEFATETKPVFSRRLAGILLKNSLSSKDEMQMVTHIHSIQSTAQLLNCHIRAARDPSAKTQNKY